MFGIHVDDTIIIMIKRFQHYLKPKIKTQYLGKYYYLLGIAISRNRSERLMVLSQMQFCHSILERLAWPTPTLSAHLCPDRFFHDSCCR